MSEVSRPKKTFAKTTIGSMVLVAILFNLVNIAYVCSAFIHLIMNPLKTYIQLCAVSNDQRLDGELDMATLFFREIFGNELAPRVMSGIIAFSIFGNIVVTTFTASRGKPPLEQNFVRSRN